MTASARAFLGATLGALLTLFIHPVSRPFLTNLFVRATPSELAAQLYQRSKRLPEPTDLSTSALWLHTAADRILAGKPLRLSECDSVISIAARCAKQDP